MSSQIPKAIGFTGMNQQELIRYLAELSGNDLGAGIVESAIKVVVLPHDIKNFYEGYVKLLKELGVAQVVADQDIGHVVGKSEIKTAERWFYILPQIRLQTSRDIYLQNIFRINERASQALERRARERLPDDSVLPTLRRKRQEGLLRA
jgi:hypothetical protein